MRHPPPDAAALTDGGPPEKGKARKHGRKSKRHGRKSKRY